MLLKKFLQSIFKFSVIQNIWASSSESGPSNMRKMYIFRSFFACAMSHLGLCSPFVHSVISNEADLGLSCPHMPEDSFSHIAAHSFLNVVGTCVSSKMPRLATNLIIRV